MRALLLAIRPYQWIKNVFILFPLIFAKQLFAGDVVVRTVIAVGLFCLMSGAIYLCNDVIDLESDRKHKDKRLRPLASGKVTVFQALVSAGVLLLITLPGAFWLHPWVGWLFLAYVFLNGFYAFFLKNAVIIDVFCIGAFFLIRLMVGAVVGGIVLSDWIILCTFLLSLFLGFCKRRYDLDEANEHRPVLKRYNTHFIDRMISVILSSLVISYALYTRDPQTVEQFGTQRLIYTVPFVYYGLFRYLYMMDVVKTGGDAAKVLFSDFKFQFNLVLWLAACVWIIYF